VQLSDKLRVSLFEISLAISVMLLIGLLSYFIVALLAHSAALHEEWYAVKDLSFVSSHLEKQQRRQI